MTDQEKSQVSTQQLEEKKPTSNTKITKDTPLTPVEQIFVTNYIKTNNIIESVKAADPVKRTDMGYSMVGHKLLRQPNVQAELKRILDELRSESVATAEEVMTYFTKVMRGEVKDQFGLDAPLSERTRAAQEIAKRTIDVDNKIKIKNETAGDVNPIQINLNWERDDNKDS